jgi:hypothetical protein
LSAPLRLPSKNVFEVPATVLSVEQVLEGLDAFDGKRVWVLGVLGTPSGQWELTDGSKRLLLVVAPELAESLPEPMWMSEGRRVAVQGAVFRLLGSEPALVVGRVITARTFGIDASTTRN